MGTGRGVALLVLVPLHPAGVEFKLAGGTSTLIEVLDRVSVSEVLDPV